MLICVWALVDRVFNFTPADIQFISSLDSQLIYLSIPVLTVFKNMTNLLIAYGDW